MNAPGLSELISGLFGVVRQDRDHAHERSMLDKKLRAENPEYDARRRAEQEEIKAIPVRSKRHGNTTLYMKNGRVVNRDGTPYINKYGRNPCDVSVQKLAENWDLMGDWYHRDE